MGLAVQLRKPKRKLQRHPFIDIVVIVVVVIVVVVIVIVVVVIVVVVIVIVIVVIVVVVVVVITDVLLQMMVSNCPIKTWLPLNGSHHIRKEEEEKS